MDEKSIRKEMSLEADVTEVLSVPMEEARESRLAAWRKNIDVAVSGRRGLVMVFVLGAVLGVGVKTIAAQRVAVGYQDYTVATSAQAYNLNDMTREVAQKGGGVQASPALGGGACGVQ